MTALETMRQELRLVHKAQADCLNTDGYVVYKDKYKHLVEQAKAYKQAIEYLVKEE